MADVDHELSAIRFVVVSENYFNDLFISFFLN